MNMHIFLIIVMLITVTPHLAFSTESLKPDGQYILIKSDYGYLHRMYFDCRGTGVPTVIIDVGIGDVSINWLPILEAISLETRTCIYDRAGYGFSDSGPGERTTHQIVEELNDLIMTADIPGPYILVGHSFGGFTAQYFSSRFKNKTVGLVLVDSSHPDQIYRLAGLDHTPHKANRGLVISDRSPAKENYTPLQKIWHQLRSGRRATFALMEELKYFKKSANQVKNSRPISRKIPLAVLTRGKQLLPKVNGIILEKEWRDMQKQLSHLSDNSWHVTVVSSGHNIHQDAPDAIIENIIKVLKLAKPEQSID